jgi:hypothetical protein
MSIRTDKARVARLAREVDTLRRARREHLSRARDIVERRLGSPAGLAVCFGAGAVAGLRFGGVSGPGSGDRAAVRDGDRAGAGFLEHMNDTAIGNIMIRLAAATLVRYMLTSSVHANGAEAGEEAPDGPADF